MATAITLECPLDGLPLTLAKVSLIRGDTSRDATSHFHLDFGTDDLTCGSGHIWTITGTLKLTRVERQRGR